MLFDQFALALDGFRNAVKVTLFEGAFSGLMGRLEISFLRVGERVFREGVKVVGMAGFEPTTP